MKRKMLQKKGTTLFTVLALSILTALVGCSSGGGGGDSTPASINNIPTAIDSKISVDEDSAFSGSLGVTDADGDSLTFRVENGPTLGTITLTDASTGAFTYKPNKDATGTDTFTFSATDGTTDSNVATVEVTINPLNDNPVATNAAFSTNEDTQITGTLSAGDVDGDTIGFSIVTSPSKGSVQITDTKTGAFAYTPNQDVNGTDIFSFKVSDGQSDSNEATVTINIASINDAPVAADSSFNTNEDNAISSTLSASDSDGDALAFSIVTTPTKGNLVITDSSTGAFTYTPDLNQNGNDAFTFKTSDGKTDSNTGTVTISIAAVNDNPTVNVPADFSADEMSQVTLVGNGSDVEDQSSVTYSWTQTGGPVQVVLQNADTATARFNAPAVETVAVIPLTFQLTVSDTQGGSTSDTVQVTIDPAGHIIGMVGSPDYHTNLTDITQTGTEDWGHFGIFTPNSFTSKQGGSNDLSDFSPTDGSTITRNLSTGNPVSFSWTDGDPDDINHNPADQTRNRVMITDAGVGEGIQLSVPAGVEDKILKVYLGAYSMKGKVTVRIQGDSSVTPYTVSLNSPDEKQMAWVVTVLCGAQSDGQTLEFDYEVEEDTGAAGGHINIAAATLTQAKPTLLAFAPLEGTYTDPLSVSLSAFPSTATIRYTTDGSQPTASSTLYSGSFSVTATQTVNAKAFYPGLTDSNVGISTYTLTAGTGTLAANITKAPYHTDLTAEGTLDWGHFGIFTANSFTHKNGGTALSNYSQVGTVTPVQSSGDPVTFTWTDGVPDDVNHNPITQTRKRVYFTDTDQDEGIRLTIPASDVEKTLRFYFGAFSMEGKIKVYMEDGSVPLFTQTVSSSHEVQDAWVLTVDFAAASGSSSNLIVEYLRGADVGSSPGGHINIAAVSLSD